MPAGRPRTVSAKPVGRPSIKVDFKEEGEALLRWANTSEALVIRSFPSTRGYSYYTMLTWLDNEEFSDYYNRAMDLIGSRREILLIESKSASPFQRYAAFYDKALADFENKNKETDDIAANIREIAEALKNSD